MRQKARDEILIVAVVSVIKKFTIGVIFTALMATFLIVYCL
jgi:hypothetical protein